MGAVMCVWMLWEAGHVCGGVGVVVVRCFPRSVMVCFDVAMSDVV